MQSQKRFQSGFSLIGLALALAAAGLLLVAYLHFVRIELEKQRIEATKQRLHVIHTALTRYVAQHQRLPCAENPIPKETKPTRFDDSNDDDDCAPDDPFHPQGGPDTPISRGVVPIRALHLDSQVALDGWGNKISYVVTKNLTLGTPLKGLTPPGGILRVIDAEGHNVLPADGQGRYVLVSHGPTGAGAWTAQGRLRPCDTDTLDGYNCNGEKVFVQAGFSTAPGSRFYDDVVLTDVLNDRLPIEKLAVCNAREKFYSPQSSGADADGCADKEGIWAGSCVLSTADASLGLKTPPVPRFVIPPAGRSVIGNYLDLVKHNQIPPNDAQQPGSCGCPAGFQMFNPGEWADHSESPAFMPTGYFDPRYPGACLVPVPQGSKMFSGNYKGLAEILPSSFCLKTFWMRSALFSCTPQ